MQVELTEEQTGKLATAIARAQLTAVDDFIKAETANWPAGMGSLIPGPGQATDAQRLMAFHSRRAAAENEMRLGAEAKARSDQATAEAQEKHMAQCQDFVDRDLLRFEREAAQWREQAHLAKSSGRPEPLKPRPAVTIADAPAALKKERADMYKIL